MSIFLSNNVIALLFLESVLFGLAIFSIFKTIKILKYWDYESAMPLQYDLEKSNYLVSTIIFFIVIIKIVLFVFFAQTVDSLSNIVPGSMCAAGVINANDYGNLLLLLKIFIIFGFSLWLIINKLDIKSIVYPYIKTKYFVFLAIFILIVLEYIVDIFYFSNISLTKPTLCCSVVFGAVTNFPFGLTMPLMIVLFYLFYVLIVLSNIIKNNTISFISSLVFLFVAYYSVVYFFGTYIYELPTHHCPFCMLQKEYYFIGYFIWISLFLAVFFGMSSFLLNLFVGQVLDSSYKLTIVFSTIFVLLCSYFVVSYYITNGVLL